MSSYFNVLADVAADGSVRQGGSYMSTLAMIAVFLLIFYFVLFRPEQKRRKKMEAQRSSIKTGDKVTAMGIIGTVAEVKDTTLILKMVDGAKIEFLKAAVTDVQAPSTEAKKVEA